MGLTYVGGLQLHVGMEKSWTWVSSQLAPGPQMVSARLLHDRRQVELYTAEKRAAGAYSAALTLSPEEVFVRAVRAARRSAHPISFDERHGSAAFCSAHLKTSKGEPTGR